MIPNFKKFISDLIKTSFVKDVGILQIERGIYILLGIANSVVLARVLGPESYGLYGLIFAFVGLVGIFMGWGAHYATLTLLTEAYNNKDKQEILNVLTYFMVITILSIIIVGILAVIFSPFFTRLLYNNNQVGNWSRLVLISGFLAIFYSLFAVVLQSIRRIRELATIEVVNKFFYVALPILLVFMGWRLSGVAWGYILSAVILSIISIVMYNRLVKQDDLLPSLSAIFLNIKNFRIKKYFNFGFMIAINKNLARFVSLLPVMFLGMFATPQDVGFYKIAFAYISIPVMLLSPISRILDVQLPKSKTLGYEVLKSHFLKTAIYSGLIALVLIIPFVILAPYLINIFYGIEYIPSVTLVYYLSILSVASGCGVGLGSFYRTVDKVSFSVVIGFLQAILMTLSIIFLVKIISPLMAVVWGTVISMVFSLPISFVIAIKILRNEE